MANRGNTNDGLKVNRLRLYRAQKEVELYRHWTSGGRMADLVSTELQLGIDALTKEIEAFTALVEADRLEMEAHHMQRDIQTWIQQGVHPNDAYDAAQRGR